jgi:hypothetical protein
VLHITRPTEIDILGRSSSIQTKLHHIPTFQDDCIATSRVNAVKEPVEDYKLLIAVEDHGTLLCTFLDSVREGLFIGPWSLVGKHVISA